MERRSIVSRRCWLTAALAIGLSVGPGTLQANPKVYEQALKSTGWVIIPREKNSALGTCWVIDRERKLVITSYHLVKDAKEALVFFPRHADGKLLVDAASYLHDAQAINARVIAADRLRDLVLLQLESLPDGVQALPVADKCPRPGDDVHSIGNSGMARASAGMLWRYTRGNVRQVYTRRMRAEETAEMVQFVETQSPVNPGDSGGPLLNDRGEVIGVAMAYDPHEQLVSHNVDGSEVRAFLKSGLTKLDAAPEKGKAQPKVEKQKPNQVFGAWKVTAKLEDGSKSRGEAQFHRDGTYVLSDGNDVDDEPQRGRFAYANGILWLITVDHQASFKLVWQSDGRFNFVANGTDMCFER